MMHLNLSSQSNSLKTNAKDSASYSLTLSTMQIYLLLVLNSEGFNI